MRANVLNLNELNINEILPNRKFSTSNPALRLYFTVSQKFSTISCLNKVHSFITNFSISIL